MKRPALQNELVGVLRMAFRDFWETGHWSLRWSMISPQMMGIDLYIWCWCMKVVYLNFRYKQRLKCVILPIKKTKKPQGSHTSDFISILSSNTWLSCININEDYAQLPKGYYQSAIISLIRSTIVASMTSRVETIHFVIKRLSAFVFVVVVVF